MINCDSAGKSSLTATLHLLKVVERNVVLPPHKDFHLHNFVESIAEVRSLDCEGRKNTTSRKIVKNCHFDF